MLPKRFVQIVHKFFELFPLDEHLILKAFDKDSDYPSTPVQPSWLVEDVNSPSPASLVEHLLSETFRTRHTAKHFSVQAAFPHVGVQCSGVLSVAGIPEPREGGIRHAPEDLLQIRLTRALTSW